MPLPRSSVRTSSYYTDREKDTSYPEDSQNQDRRVSDSAAGATQDEERAAVPQFSLKESLERLSQSRNPRHSLSTMEGNAPKEADPGRDSPIYGRKSIGASPASAISATAVPLRNRMSLASNNLPGMGNSGGATAAVTVGGHLSSRSRMPSAAVLPPPPPVPLPSMPVNSNFNPYRPPHDPAAGSPREPAGAEASAEASKEADAGPAPPHVHHGLYNHSNAQPRISLFDFRMDADSEAQNCTIPGLPAKTGTGMPVLGHHPCLAMEEAVPREQPQYLCFSNNHLAAEMMSHDAERMAHPLDVKNRVVYDSLDVPPPCQTSAPPATSAASAAAAAAAVGPPAPRPPGPTPAASAGGGSSEAAIPVTGGADPLGFNANPGTYQDGMLPPPYYQVEGPDDTTLVFESRFESGNLRRAIQVYDNEYDLILRPDINTRGHTQWFYFSVANTRANTKYKLNIINMVKSDSLYQWGMQPLICSEKDCVAKGCGWVRVGSNISYYQNNIKRKNGHYYYTFTVTLTFPHDHDTIYLAHCYPYTYSDLQRYLRKLEEDPKRRQRFRRRVLCQTLAGNNCDLLTITSFGGDPESLRHRRGVVISGRVHPGESNASWMMKGTLDFLTGPSLDAKILRDNFVFKVVPMLNPDGVINGNYRCSLAGVDLNRVWNDPSKKLHPTIFHTKAMIKRLMEDREVVMFCDFHGHSRKKNVFMYGCEKKVKSRSVFDDTRSRQDSQQNMIGSTVVGNRLLERVFPCALWHSSPDIFAFSDCNFKVQKAKETTARVVLWREFNLVNSFTLEASFAGPSSGREAGTHFTKHHLQNIGASFCDTLLDYCDPDPTRMQGVLRELEMLFPPKQNSNSYEQYVRPREPPEMPSAGPAPMSMHAGNGAGSMHAGNGVSGAASASVGAGSGERAGTGTGTGEGKAAGVGGGNGSDGNESGEEDQEGEDVDALSDSDDSDSDSDDDRRKRLKNLKKSKSKNKKGVNGAAVKEAARKALASVAAGGAVPSKDKEAPTSKEASSRDRWRGAVAVIANNGTATKAAVGPAPSGTSKAARAMKGGDKASRRGAKETAADAPDRAPG